MARSWRGKKKDNDELHAILEEIRTFCRENADEKQAAKYARYFKEGYDAYGINQGVWEEYKKSFLDKYCDKLDMDGFLSLGELLLESGKYEEASFAIHFAKQFEEQYTGETFQRIGGWLSSGIRNWGHTDVICSEVLSRFFIDGIVSYTDMSSWRDYTSKWRRRAVPVAMIKLLKTEKDPVPLLDFIRPMMMDNERVVHQGLGWFLRETWKKHPAQVESFLLQWKDSSPRLIIQYATEKMTQENKARFKKASKKN